MMVSVFIRMKHSMYASSSVVEVRVVETDGHPFGYQNTLSGTDWVEVVGIKLTDAATMLALVDEERDG